MTADPGSVRDETSVAAGAPRGRWRRWCAFTALLGLLAAASLLLRPPASPGGATFTDVSEALGLDFVHENGARGQRHLPEVTVGGAAWIDYDRDGYPDLYLVNGNLHSDRGGESEAGERGAGGSPMRDRLFRNERGRKLREVTEEVGLGSRLYGSGVAVGDYDNDGWPDLFVTNLGRNLLYHNEGGRGFRDVTAAAGVAGGGWSTSAAFFDFDLDGRLDLYVARYVDYDPTRRCHEGGLPVYCSPHEFPGVPDILYHNRGDGTFEDVTEKSGVGIGGPAAGKSLGVVTLDIDADGDPDIYVACDQVPNLLFRNLGEGVFREEGLLADVAFSAAGEAQAGMGVDAGDADGDGLEDIIVVNFADEPCALYRSLGGGLYEDASLALDVAGPTLEPLGFGVLFIDPDLDGDLDLYVANGHVIDNIALLRPGRTFAQRDLYLENRGGKAFRDASADAGAWFQRATVSRSVATADLDLDGDEDLVVLSSGERAVVLRCDAPRSHWIAFDLEGRRSARDAIGARITLHLRRESGASTLVRVRRSARGYAAASDPRTLFGLGKDAVTVERVEVEWPSGTSQTLPTLQIDRAHKIVEPEHSSP